MNTGIEEDNPAFQDINMLGQTFTVWIPIFVNFSSVNCSRFSGYFSAIYIVEMLAYLLNSFRWYGIRAMKRSALFHCNTVTCISYYAVTLTVSDVMRISIILSQIGVIRRDDYPLVFLVLGFCRMFCLVMLPYMMTTVFLERIFSTIYIRDYETKTRRHIPHLMFVTIAILSILQASISVLRIISPIANITIGISMVAICLVTFQILFHYNKWYLKEARGTGNSEYTLSLRFQLKENFRMLTAIRNCAYGCGILAFIMGSSVYATIFYFGEGTLLGQLSLAIFDCTAGWIGIVLPIIVLLTVHEGRKGLESRIIYALHCGRWTFSDARKTKVFAKNEASMYFEQLESAWK